ncbi:hypothetical protein CDN99_17300 [Roseateles aquatilis]|uniref:Uncharacterized protein n=1 Tax=Roseateles aquatilis TaxID=431061 RepID=A0A246J7U6_9BURK|nr:hypothetical protein [Roseateles aquatilis]OWQ88599.1 hypothetical protein CDN99_17300 [Roseateles aquatilis]
MTHIASHSIFYIPTPVSAPTHDADDERIYDSIDDEQPGYAHLDRGRATAKPLHYDGVPHDEATDRGASKAAERKVGHSDYEEIGPRRTSVFDPHTHPPGKPPRTFAYARESDAARMNARPPTPPKPQKAEVAPERIYFELEPQVPEKRMPPVPPFRERAGRPQASNDSQTARHVDARQLPASIAEAAAAMARSRTPT